MRPDATRDEGLRELGVHERLREIAYLPSGQRRSHGERTRLLDEYKAELKKKKHSLALELHPDVNRGEDEVIQKERSHKLQRALRAIDFVSNLNAREHRPRPRRVMVVLGASGIVSGVDMMSTGTTANPWHGIVR